MSWNKKSSDKVTSEEASKFDSYESRNDSGFLSGANIISDTLISGELTSSSGLDEPKSQPSCSSSFSGKFDEDSKSYMRLDSGVDVGLSDQLSELCIDSSLNDLSCKSSTASILSSDVKHSLSNVCETELNKVNSKQQIDERATPWQLYFDQDEEGDTQLHIAVIHGYADVVSRLISMVPEPKYLNLSNDLRQTALHLAVLTSQPAIARRLVLSGVQTDFVDRHGNTPLHLATAAGDVECVKALTQPISPNEVQSVGLRYSPPLRSSKAPPEINYYNYEGLTCVHMAVMAGHYTILRHLVWSGADIDAREMKGGSTAIHLAVEAGNESLVRLLVTELQAEPNLPNYAERTPYSYAVRSHPSIARLLQLAGAFTLDDYLLSDDEQDDDLDESDFLDEYQSYPPFFNVHPGIVTTTAA